MARVVTAVAAAGLAAVVACGPGGPDSGDAPAPAAPLPVWIDTDPSVMPGGHEVDDGFALVQAFHSPELVVRGVTTVFGNAPLDETWPIGRDIVERFGPPSLGVWPGAAGPEDLGIETEASRALADALQREPLTILVLGPATNVATVLMRHPNLAGRVREIVAVAGRRPGQRFLVGTREDARPLRDLNFDLNPEAFEVLLDSGVPVVLAPWEISSQVWLDEADVDRLEASNDAARFLVEPTRDVLERFWRARFGVDGLNPFDTLAVGYLTSPELLTCDEWPVEIPRLPDDTTPAGARPADKPYLLVDPDIASDRRVRYCHTPAPEFRDDLMRRLTTTR